MSTLNPTLAGAVLKTERNIAFLHLPNATSDHLRQAMDCLKSAHKLAASHHTVLVELEDQVPEPGPALFDGTGAPAPGVAMAAPVTSDDVILDLPASALETMDWNEEKRAHQDLLFAVRTHFRARGFDLDKWHAFFEDMDKDIGITEAWDWIIQQVKTGGDFIWPHRCSGGCGLAIEAPEEGEESTPCYSCQRAKRDQEAKDKKAAAKAEKPKAEKKPKKGGAKPPANPLHGTNSHEVRWDPKLGQYVPVSDQGGEGGDE